MIWKSLFILDFYLTPGQQLPQLQALDENSHESFSKPNSEQDTDDCTDDKAKADFKLRLRDAFVQVNALVALRVVDIASVLFELLPAPRVCLKLKINLANTCHNSN